MYINVLSSHSSEYPVGNEVVLYWLTKDARVTCMQKGTSGLVLRLVRAPPPNLTPADTYTHLNSGPVTHPVDSTKAIALLPVRLNPDVPRNSFLLCDLHTGDPGTLAQSPLSQVVPG